MDDELITIMTPTYNRANLLKRLYESLLEQKNTNFEWLIVDDGSTDNTKSLVDKLINKRKIKIRYIFQKNGGKYKAFNTGIEAANGKLFFCVDSDDVLASDVIDLIEMSWHKIKNLQNVSGILALKVDSKGILLSDRIPEGLKLEHLYSLNTIYNIKGEFSLVYKTEILKEYKFPDVSPEKFVGECVLYDQIDKSYKMYIVNSIFTICEYQSDGYTNNIVSNMIKNPTGYKIYYSQRIDMANTLKERISYIVRYNAFAKMSKDKRYMYKGKYSILVKLFSITGVLGKKYYYRKMK
jgi:glycosyltransferase involved in cell wall biosynthesis